jgi:hypothetical protein
MMEYGNILEHWLIILFHRSSKNISLLPPFLTKLGGLDSGFMLTQYTIHGRQPLWLAITRQYSCVSNCQRSGPISVLQARHERSLKNIHMGSRPIQINGVTLESVLYKNTMLHHCASLLPAVQCPIVHLGYCCSCCLSWRVRGQTNGSSLASSNAGDNVLTTKALDSR